MIWNRPKEGDVRLVREFALFPVGVEGHKTAWLQWVWKKQRYVYFPDAGWWLTVAAYGEQPE